MEKVNILSDISYSLRKIANISLFLWHVDIYWSQARFDLSKDTMAAAVGLIMKCLGAKLCLTCYLMILCQYPLSLPEFLFYHYLFLMLNLYT